LCVVLRHGVMPPKCKDAAAARALQQSSLVFGRTLSCSASTRSPSAVSVVCICARTHPIGKKIKRGSHRPSLDRNNKDRSYIWVWQVLYLVRAEGLSKCK
jgi:hypothetical protein